MRISRDMEIPYCQMYGSGHVSLYSTKLDREWKPIGRREAN